jgi:aminoglycoside 3-N-acetyltransferase
MTSILFKTGNSLLSVDNFVDALRNVGVNDGDVIFVHSDISAFGMPLSFEKDLLLKGLFDIFKKVIGDTGLLILPTFSYSFCKNEIFDVQNTRSTVGSLTEWFRNQEGVIRSKHPIFSVAYKGNKGYSVDLQNISTDSFDRQSIFGKLHKLKGKIVLFGVDLETVTFIHYVEQFHGVPYRYHKKFKGVISDNGRQYPATYSFYVRNEAVNPILDLANFGSYLTDRNLLKKVKVGNGVISVVDSDVLFVEGLKMLNKDINYFLKKGTVK